MSVNPFNLLKSATWRFGFALRETGQALERVGCQLQGIYSHTEISRCPGFITAPMVLLNAKWLGRKFTSNLAWLDSLLFAANRHTPILPIQYDAPSIASDVFVAPSSVLVGKVSVGPASSIWYNATVRGKRKPTERAVYSFQMCREQVLHRQTIDFSQGSTSLCQLAGA